MASSSSLLSCPQEILLDIFERLDNVTNISSLCRTCSYLRNLLIHHEVTISKSLSKNPEFNTPSSTPLYTSVVLIYPPNINSYSPTGNPSYAWLRLLEYRVARVKNLHALEPPDTNYFSHVFGTGRWHYPATHYYWRFLESTTDIAAVAFLASLDSRAVIHVFDILDTSKSCAMVAATYKFLPVPGDPSTLRPSFTKFMKEMLRMYSRGHSTRLGKPRGIWIGMKGFDSADLLRLAEMFMAEDPDVLVGNDDGPGGPPAENMVPCAREEVLVREHHVRVKEIGEGLAEIYKEMGKFGWYC